MTALPGANVPEAAGASKLKLDDGRRLIHAAQAFRNHTLGHNSDHSGGESWSHVPAMSSFFFSTPVDIDIVLDDGDNRQMVDVKLDKNRREKAPLYMDGESVKGAVTIRPKDGKRLEHTGIKVKFVGTIGQTLPFTT
jgi:hypothetical protein